MVGQDYESLGRPHHRIIVGQLWQAAELGEAKHPDQMGIAFFARLETNLLLHKRYILRQVMEWLSSLILVGCQVVMRDFEKGICSSLRACMEP